MIHSQKQTRLEVSLETAEQCENFSGRLGDYRYDTMGQVVARALELFMHLARGCAL